MSASLGNINGTAWSNSQASRALQFRIRADAVGGVAGAVPSYGADTPERRNCTDSVALRISDIQRAIWVER